MTPEQKAAYLKSPYHCPYCKSRGIETGIYNGELQRQTIQCNDCGKEWYEWFKIIEITDKNP